MDRWHSRRPAPRELRRDPTARVDLRPGNMAVQIHTPRHHHKARGIDAVETRGIDGLGDDPATLDPDVVHNAVAAIGRIVDCAADNHIGRMHTKHRLWRKYWRLWGRSSPPSAPRRRPRRGCVGKAMEAVSQGSQNGIHGRHRQRIDLVGHRYATAIFAEHCARYGQHHAGTANLNRWRPNSCGGACIAYSHDGDCLFLGSNGMLQSFGEWAHGEHAIDLAPLDELLRSSFPGQKCRPRAVGLGNPACRAVPPRAVGSDSSNIATTGIDSIAQRDLKRRFGMRNGTH